MRCFSPEEIEEARQIDLLTYLRANEPFELVKVTNNVHCTREHNSLRISNGKWMWFSQGFGGKSALDYLIQVKGYRFDEAVEKLLGGSKILPNKVNKIQTEKKSPRLIIPIRNDTNAHVIRYLSWRGIDQDIIKTCIEEGLLYEAKFSENAVFIGFDEAGTARYAAYRATSGERVMSEASGSDKSYSFRLINKESNVLRIFESAIDLLSYATLMKLDCKNYKDENLLSLAGVYGLKRDGKPNKLPKALTNFLNNNNQIKEIHLHLDNDPVGRNAALAIGSQLEGKYMIFDEPPLWGKDVNDYLVGLRNDDKRRAYYQCK